MENNKGRNLTQTFIYNPSCDKYKLTLNTNFSCCRHWDTQNFGDSIQVDGNLGFEILDCYFFKYINHN